MKAAIHIGAEVKKGSINKMHKLILDILATSAGDEVKKAALSTMGSAFKVEGVSISSCNFRTKR